MCDSNPDFPVDRVTALDEGAEPSTQETGWQETENVFQLQRLSFGWNKQTQTDI